MSNPLSNDLIAQFAKAAVGGDENKQDTALRGTITRVVANEGEEGVLCVKIDGSDIETPVSRFPSTIADFAEDDRVEIAVKNHALTITGNTTKPAIGIMTKGNLESRIEQTVDKITAVVKGLDSTATAEMTASQITTTVQNSITGLSSKIDQTATDIRSEVSDLNNNLSSKITQNATNIESTVKKQEEFSTFKQTFDTFTFITGDNGIVKISSGNLQLTGAISFSELSDGETVKNDIKNAKDIADAAWSRATTAKNVADDAYDIAVANELPDYLETTYINSTTVMSPAIIGGTFWAVSNEGSYLQMQYDGIEIYEYGIKNPKFSVTNMDDFVRLTLGSGTYDNGSSNGRFFIDKDTDSTSIYYLSATTNGKIGFTFNDDGTITVHGTLNT